jgi:hypothetical protein
LHLMQSWAFLSGNLDRLRRLRTLPLRETT